MSVLDVIRYVLEIVSDDANCKYDIMRSEGRMNNAGAFNLNFGRGGGNYNLS